MILQALYRLAEVEDLVSDPDYEPKPVAYLVRVGDRGQLLSIESTKQPPTNGRGAARAKSFSIPRQAHRTSGRSAQFLFDKAEYVFGIDPAGKRKEKELALRFELFRELVEECVAATDDEAVRAVGILLKRIANEKEIVTLPDDVASNDLFGFVYSQDVNRFITERSAVVRYWKSLRSEQAEVRRAQCLVTGEVGIPARLVPQIKRVPGGSTSGVGLVSFNRNAYESQGWEGNENAPISREAAEAVTTALNRLLHPAYPVSDGVALPRRNLRIGTDSAVCYWAPDGDTPPIFGIMEADVEEVPQLYRSLWSGRPVEIEDSSAFYALTLTGTQGRVMIRDWFESTVVAVQKNLALHFSDLDIVRCTPPPKRGGHPPSFPMGTLLESIADRRDNRREGVPAPLATELVRSTLSGRLYPRVVMQRALQRYRAELGRTNDDQVGWITKNWNDARSALIKAELNRRNRGNQSWQEVRRNMDPNNANPGYRLGALLAVLERLQKEALGDVNASVVDRYFSGASAAPKTVFVSLVKNARHHVRKAKDGGVKTGQVIRLDRLVDELLMAFQPSAPLYASSAGFPAHLDLDQQGLFVLGFHHMRKWLWLNKEERRLWESDYPDAPRAYRWSREPDTARAGNGT